MRVHLYVVNNRDEVLVDEDVNDVQIHHGVQYRVWEPGAKGQAVDHFLSLSDLKTVELTPCRDRLVQTS